MPEKELPLHRFVQQELLFKMIILGKQPNWTEIEKLLRKNQKYVDTQEGDFSKTTNCRSRLGKMTQRKIIRKPIKKCIHKIFDQLKKFKESSSLYSLVIVPCQTL